MFSPTSKSCSLPALFVYFVFILWPGTSHLAQSADFSFDFQSFSIRNLTLLGDSYIRNGVVGLTRYTTVPASSAGTVIYNNPVPFYDPGLNTTASFSTRFAFSIPNSNPASYGDGFTFFISRDNQLLGSPGGYLGLVNSSVLTKYEFIAIEFDSKLDVLFDDPDESHVGLDIDSLTSVKTVNPASHGIDMKSGTWINCWIDYMDDFKKLKVFLNYSSSKPSRPLLAVHVDLSQYLKEVMYVGFSGANEGSTELHLISNWTFSTSLPQVPYPLHPPHNVSDSSVTTPVISVSSNTGDSHNRRLGLGLGIAGPAFFCVLLALFGYVSSRKLKKMRRCKSLKPELVAGPREYSYKELSTATRDFHSSRIIGKGAFGNVYKAFFVPSGTVAAVKRSKHSHEGKTEFLAELSIIACLRHKNLVQLLGWCSENGELLLVYEFMPYGSLDVMLYQDFPLPWGHRMNIVIGLASALTYLHQECEQQVIHRDIKTSNVLLDGNFNSKLGDFGLARLMDHDKSPVSTLTAGTMGYLAPEYLQCGKATEKTDVYSFGVVVLEVACGRRPIFEREPTSQKMINLIDWVWNLHGEGRIIDAADKRLNAEFSDEEMERLFLVGLSCVTPDSGARPTMRKVLQILKHEADPLPVPKVKPTLSFSCGLSLTLHDIVSDCD